MVIAVFFRWNDNVKNMSWTKEMNCSVCKNQVAQSIDINIYAYLEKIF